MIKSSKNNILKNLYQNMKLYMAKISLVAFYASPIKSYTFQFYHNADSNRKSSNSENII